MAMKRIWFVGDTWPGHPAMPGIVLTPGMAVDVPEDLARKLVASKDFVDQVPVTKGVDVVRQVTKAFTEIADPHQRPKTLLEISGIGPGTVDRLNAYGIHSVDDLAELGESVLHDIAQDTPGISKSLLRRWRLIAQS